MPSKRLHWRALAGLGALLLATICVWWPLICAAAALPVMPHPHRASSSSSSSMRSSSSSSSVNPSFMTKFLSVLNVNNENVSDASGLLMGRHYSVRMRRLMRKKVSSSELILNQSPKLVTTTESSNSSASVVMTEASSGEKYHLPDLVATTVLTNVTTTVDATTSSSTAATRKRNSNLERNERSANLSHITGTARKIQLLLKNRMIQILPDGTVNGTQDDGSEYSEFGLLLCF